MKGFNSAVVLLFAQLTLTVSNPSVYVDLSHTQDEGALGWPSFKPFELKTAIAEYVLQEPRQW